MTEAELLADIAVKNPEIQEIGQPQSMEKEHASFPDVKYKFVLALSEKDGIAIRHKIIYYVREIWDRTDPDPENHQKTGEEAFYKDKQPAPTPVKDPALIALETGIRALPGYIIHEIKVFDKPDRYAEFMLVKETAGGDPGSAVKVLMAAKKEGADPIKFWEFT